MTTAATLLRWYKKFGRDLPWRNTRDAYRILVSELMLQQTQVPRVLLFYPTWLARFPTWEALSVATNADVIHAWAGLGYNRRALMLRDIARQIVANGLPTNEAEWLALKGIGPYTSAALAAFSLHERTLPIDTNIRRTVGRILLGLPYPQPESDERIRRAADQFLPTNGRYFDIPQALFDLATMICTKVPSCATCPLRQTCKAAPKFLTRRIRIPKAMIKKAVETKHRGKKYPDRIYRGRILSLIRKRTEGVAINEIGRLVDPTFESGQDRPWLVDMLRRLEKDGFVRTKNGRTRLVD